MGNTPVKDIMNKQGEAVVLNNNEHKLIKSTTCNHLKIRNKHVLISQRYPQVYFEYYRHSIYYRLHTS